MRWMELLTTSLGTGPSTEIVAAHEGLDRSAQRHARRLVRNGRAAPNVPIARLAAHLPQSQCQQSEAITLVTHHRMR
jgi:hypothetical protein